ncbi:MAG: hypothetical protein AAF639_30345, partial [Chloroflexota bacterium]
MKKSVLSTCKIFLWITIVCFLIYWDNNYVSATISHSESDTNAASLTVDITTTIQAINKDFPIPFTVSVRNNGDRHLNNVTAPVYALPPILPPLLPPNTEIISDAIIAGCNFGEPVSLAVGDIRGYSCEVSGNEQDFTAVVVAQGETPAGDVIEARDELFLDVIAAEIDIGINTNTPIIVTNDPVTFTIAITNTGN